MLLATLMCLCFGALAADVPWAGNGLTGDQLYQYLTRDFEWVTFGGDLMIKDGDHLNGAFAVNGDLSPRGFIDDYDMPSYVTGNVLLSSPTFTVNKTGFDFAAVEREMIAYSQSLAANPATPVIHSLNDLTAAGLTTTFHDGMYNEQSLLVNIPLGRDVIFAEDFSWTTTYNSTQVPIRINLINAGDIRFDTPPTADFTPDLRSNVTILGNSHLLRAPFIHGVSSAAGEMNSQFPTLSFDPDTNSWVFGKMPLLLNFPNATEVKLAEAFGANYYGNILAPKAHVQSTHLPSSPYLNVMNIDGDIIAKSITMEHMSEGHAWGGAKDPTWNDDWMNKNALRIHKTVVTDNAPKDAIFTIKLEFETTPDTRPGIDDDKRFSTLVYDVGGITKHISLKHENNYKAEVLFYLKDGETVHLHNFFEDRTDNDKTPHFTYKVTEINNQPGWTLESISNATGSVDPNGLVEVEVKNSYAEVPSHGFDIYKRVLGRNAPPAVFKLYVTLKNGNGTPYTQPVWVDNALMTPNANGQLTLSIQGEQRIKLRELPVGVQYSVLEDRNLPGGWFINMAFEPLNGTVTETIQTATAYNQYDPDDGAYFYLKKAVEGADAPADAEFTFRVSLFYEDGVTPYHGFYQLSGSRYSGGKLSAYDGEPIEVKLKAGETFGLVRMSRVVTYQIEEIDIPSGFLVQGSSVLQGNGIDHNNLVVTNIYRGPMDYVIEKRVTGDPAPADQAFTFELNLYTDPVNKVHFSGSYTDGNGNTHEYKGRSEQLTLKAGEQYKLIGLPANVQVDVREINVPVGYAPAMTTTIDPDHHATYFVFENTYTAPVVTPTPAPTPTAAPTATPTATPAPTIPKTGDRTPLALFMVLLVLSLMAPVALTARKKHN